MNKAAARLLPPLLLLFGLCTAGAAEKKPVVPKELKLRVVSFNLRVPVDKPPNDWKTRKLRLIKDIERLKPDVMGVQEATPAHHTAFKTLKNYRCIGSYTDRVKRREGVQIYYNAQRFTVINTTTTWLSETPQIQSFAKGANLPRAVTIGVFKEKATGRHFVVANTHLHHKNAEVCHPIQVKALLRALRPYLEDKMTVFLTGDFNARPGGIAYTALSQTLRDAHEISEKPPVLPEHRTFHGFRSRSSARHRKIPDTARIDYIWVTPDTRVLRYESVDNFDKNGLASSDPYPQCADVVF